jgi:hypothetical protein
LTAIRETCPCGATIRIKHPVPAPIAQDWRSSHLCDRRDRIEREVVTGATAEQAYTEPHRTDSELHFGFHRSDDDTEPLQIPPATRRDLREVRA